MGDPSAKTLTDRLRMLEHQGILTRTVHAEVPPRVVYDLTEQGRSLREILHAMLRWGEANPAPVHPNRTGSGLPRQEPTGSRDGGELRRSAPLGGH